MRCTSNGSLLYLRTAFTTIGPIVRLGTKWPSITSTWIQSAPASVTAATSCPSAAKSADRIDGAMRTGCCGMTDLDDRFRCRAFQVPGVSGAGTGRRVPPLATERVHREGAERLELLG